MLQEPPGFARGGAVWEHVADNCDGLLPLWLMSAAYHRSKVSPHLLPHQKIGFKKKIKIKKSSCFGLKGEFVGRWGNRKQHSALGLSWPLGCVSFSYTGVKLRQKLLSGPFSGSVVRIYLIARDNGKWGHLGVVTVQKDLQLFCLLTLAAV